MRRLKFIPSCEKLQTTVAPDLQIALPWARYPRNQILLVFSATFLLLLGCKQAGNEAPKIKPPRPVEVATLQLQSPSSQAIITASAASWKTEQIGFEISGRIEWVAEPNSDIEGHVVNDENQIVIQGTPIAQINDEKYRLEVEKATAELSRSKQSVAAAQVEIDKSLPAQFAAAEADLELATVDRDRRVRLVNKDAGSQADADKAEATLKNAAAAIEQLESKKQAKESELESLKLQVQIANQSLQEANRNLNNCVLHSSFRGQIADVAVVPGSFVASGNPVATIQMMNPIKIEFELSASDSRRIRKRQQINVLVTQLDGSKENHDGFLHVIDPVADPQTRTFTATVLMENRKTALTKDESTIPVIDQT